MPEQVIIIYGDSFHDESPRMRRLSAERTVDRALAGLKKPSLFRRALAWLGIKKGN